MHINLPFVESLYFCGDKITTNKDGIIPTAIQAVLKEWDLYCQLLVEKPIIKEIHLGGGGTPTFFSVEYLIQLIQGILAKAEVAEDYEFSLVMAIPIISRATIRVLYMILGFRYKQIFKENYNGAAKLIINHFHQGTNGYPSAMRYWL